MWLRRYGIARLRRTRMTMLWPGCRRRYPGRTALHAKREATEVRGSSGSGEHMGEQQQAERNGGSPIFGVRQRNSSESAKA